MPTDPVDRVVAMVDAQTSPKQPDAVRLETIMVVAQHSNLSTDEARSAIDLALEEDRLEAVDGRLRGAA
ncbi:hypothetical protein [Salinilacihabitans rarus]|uniref:hypothetical protein n=1 Tax=Salinilacihabitans rarus TaxID=2961596 RepID=UPI0020C83C52|nr:hypothetical protein [Salinilacihabitans rarus]